MEISYFIFGLILILLGLNIYFTIKNQNFLIQLKPEDTRLKLEIFEKAIIRIDTTLKEELQKNREELSKNILENRQELSGSFNLLNTQIINTMSEIAGSQKESLKIFSDQLSELTKTNENRFNHMISTTEQKLESMRHTIETKLNSIQKDTNDKLEIMRATVDEKLHKTLEQRLNDSFKIVSERLEKVHQGLGEMQNLAVGVGDLKKVLTNVKTKGILGEYQLENILEQILSPQQYAKNISTKKGSRDVVEFAIKLPGKDDCGKQVYLPIDSKLPLEAYYNLLDSYEKADTLMIDQHAKILENTIKKNAKDIADKYIDPPNTTDFGIMFLPIEGLYAEIVRKPLLFETLQKEYKITVTGPSTLAAILNSLNMGFRTLAIEKRSSEVWKILGAVKTEFGKFENVLKSAQKKIRDADNEIENLVGTRSNQIQRSLKNVETLPGSEALLYLPENPGN
jgi:DNA recombination protein RmuC